MATLLARAAAALLLAGALVGCGPESPENLMSQAQTALQKQDRKAAEIHLKNLLQQVPGNGEARAMLAGIYAAAGDARSAEKEWRRALEAGVDPNRTVPGLLEALVLSGDSKAAIGESDKHALTSPDAKATTAYWVGRAHLAQNRPEEATRAFQAALADRPNDGRAQTGLIQIQAGRGDVDGARAAIDTLLAKDPDVVDALLLKADLQLAQGDVAGARDSLGRLLALDANAVGARVKLTSILIDAREYDQAQTQLAALQKSAPGAPITLHLKATLDFRQNRLDAARDTTQQVLKLAPDYLPALALAANVALVQNALEQAERYARQLVERAPNSIQGQRLLGATYLRKNDPDRALQAVRPLLERGVKDPALLAIAGEAALKLNDTKAATTYFEQATQLDPKDAGKRTGLAIARLSGGQHDAGIADLEAASELDTAGTQADYALVMTHLRDKQFDRALQAVDRLEKKQPDKPLPHNLRGMALLARGDAAGARASFERALQLDPAFFAAAANLASLDLRDKKPADAKARFDGVLQKEPHNAQALLALASLTTQTGGSRDDALKYLKQAQANNPGAVPPVLALSAHYLQANQPREAIPLLQQTLAQNPDNAQLLDALGTAYLRNDDKQQAMETFEKLVRLNAKSAPLHLRLGELKAAMGDNAGALASFRQAEQLQPKAVEPRIAIAAQLLRSGRKDEARKVAAALQKDLPASPAGLALEGDLLAADQKWAEAAAVYRRAAAIQRTTPLVIKQHQALQRAGRGAEAEALLRDALKASPQDVALRMYVGELQIANRQWQAAADTYDALVKENPRNVIALNNLAWSLHQLKDRRAAQLAEQAYGLAPKAPAVVDTLGQILLDSGSKDRGLELLKQAAELAPKTPVFRLHYAEALARTGDRDGARRELDVVMRDFPDSAQAKAARDIAAKL